MSTTPVIKIVIPVYYLPELYITIKKCLDSLKMNYPDWEVITIDDSLIDCPFGMSYKNSQNLGYTASVNRGLDIAFKDADIVIVCNNDLEFESGQLDRYKTIKNGIYFPSDTASGNLDIFGSIFGMNKATYIKLGGLNEKYKHFYSDRDYYNRAKKLNIPVVNWPDIRIQHHESATYNKLNKSKLLKEDERKFYGNVGTIDNSKTRNIKSNT